MVQKESVLTKIPHSILEEVYNVGIDVDEKARSGTLFHVDQSTVYTKINEYFRDNGYKEGFGEVFLAPRLYVEAG
jgi:hypothetical protein